MLWRFFSSFLLVQIIIIYIYIRYNRTHFCTYFLCTKFRQVFYLQHVHAERTITVRLGKRSAVIAVRVPNLPMHRAARRAMPPPRTTTGRVRVRYARCSGPLTDSIAWYRCRSYPINTVALQRLVHASGGCGGGYADTWGLYRWVSRYAERLNGFFGFSHPTKQRKPLTLRRNARAPRDNQQRVGRSGTFQNNSWTCTRNMSFPPLVPLTVSHYARPSTTNGFWHQDVYSDDAPLSCSIPSTRGV